MASPNPSLSTGDLAAIDAQLADTDRLLEQSYPGDDGSRQPVHTVYVLSLIHISEPRDTR